MWILYGLGLAVVSWARIAAARRAVAAAPERAGEVAAAAGVDAAAAQTEGEPAA